VGRAVSCTGQRRDLLCPSEPFTEHRNGDVSFVFCRMSEPRNDGAHSITILQRVDDINGTTTVTEESRLLRYYAMYIGICGPGSSVGIATELRAGRSGIESRWGRDFPPVQTGPGAHPASCKMGTGSFFWGKVRSVRAADHSPPSSAAVMEEKSYTSTHILGHTGPVTRTRYLLHWYIYIYIYIFHRYGGLHCLHFENNRKQKLTTAE